MERRRRPVVNLEMLKKIQEVNFALLETVLYLNTHPEDREVLKLHNDLAAEYQELVEKYQKRYGPLYPNNPDAEYPWHWIDSPWPWEINY